MTDYYDTIKRLFSNVLYEDIQQYRISQNDIRTGIQNMKDVYKPNPTKLSSDVIDVANYNDPAHRCAYLHKYAPLHTALVRDMLSRSMQQVKFIFHDILSETGRIEVCSLGGGPGSDVLGVISVLSAELGFFQLSATVIDCMENWKYTFGGIIKELRFGSYGFISNFVQPQYFSWNYIGHNLLGKMTNDVNKAIQNAKLITMVKFVSAAACKDTFEMVQKIFRSLKPGALILFIDNDAGGFYRLMTRSAQEYNLKTVFGPLIHEHYVNRSFDIRRFGYTPCLETKVTVHMWMKPNRNRSNILSAASLGNSSRVQTGNINTTFNRHNISNIYVPETNNLNLTNQNQFLNLRQQNEIKSCNIPIKQDTQKATKQDTIQQNKILTSSSNVTNKLKLSANVSQNKVIQYPRQENGGVASSQRHTSGSGHHSVQSYISNSKTNVSSPQRTTSQNTGQRYVGNPSTLSPNQKQPQYQALPNNSRPVSQNYNRDENEVDCCCCVIS